MRSFRIVSVKIMFCILEKHIENFRTMSDTITETIYIAKDRDGNCRYVGRTKLPLARRRQLHAEQLRTDWLACPLCRFMHDEGSTFDDENGWSIEPLATVAFPDTPELGAMIEHEAIEWFRRTYGTHLILNTNRPMCSSARAKHSPVVCIQGFFWNTK